MSKPNSPHSPEKTMEVWFGDHPGSQGVKTSASGNTDKDEPAGRKPEGQGAFLRCVWLSVELEFSGV